MSILGNLISAVRKQQDSARINRSDIAVKVEGHISDIGYENFDKACLENIINNVRPDIERFGFDANAINKINQLINDYYKSFSYTVEVTYKQEVNGFTNCDYKLHWPDGSSVEAGYIGKSRATNAPLKSRYKEILADVEAELVKQGVKIADIEIRIPSWYK